LFLGTFKTPQLLEPSGIGDRSLLKSFSIEMLIDLPGVGENLLEQTYTLIVVYLIRRGIQMGMELALEEVRLEDHDNKDDPIQAIRMRLRMRSGKRDLCGEGHHCCASALMVGTLLAMLLLLLVASQHGQ